MLQEGKAEASALASSGHAGSRHLRLCRCSTALVTPPLAPPVTPPLSPPVMPPLASLITTALSPPATPALTHSGPAFCCPIQYAGTHPSGNAYSYPLQLLQSFPLRPWQQSSRMRSAPLATSPPLRSGAALAPSRQPPPPPVTPPRVYVRSTSAPQK